MALRVTIRRYTPLDYYPEAQEFARRGWTAVVVMRRGFGDSGGGYAEDPGSCGLMMDYVTPTKQAVIDLRAAAAYLATRPEVDPSRMIAIGHSTGGLSMVGLAADPPPNLVAAISFAGGRGWIEFSGSSCAPEVLVNAFAEFRQARARSHAVGLRGQRSLISVPTWPRNFIAHIREAEERPSFILDRPIRRRWSWTFFEERQFRSGRPSWTTS